MKTDDQTQAYAEYRAHGGKLDFTAWQEQQEQTEPEEQPKPEALPLCEALLSELSLITDPRFAQEHGYNAALQYAQATIRKHFAALTVEEVRGAVKAYPIKVVIAGANLTVYHNDETANEVAQAVLRLLRRG